MSEKAKSWFLLPLNEEKLIFPLFTKQVTHFHRKWLSIDFLSACGLVDSILRVGINSAEPRVWILIEMLIVLSICSLVGLNNFA